MNSRTYALVMTTLSFVGLIVMLLAMSAIEHKRNTRAAQMAAGPYSDQERLPVLKQVIDFALTNQAGEEISRADMAGKIWVANFIFTSCPTICPNMTRGMASLQADFAVAEDVHFVSITVDPKRDTPEVLTDYAKQYDANLDRWDFLTGTKEAIQTLSVEGFMIGSGDEMINHSPKFALVDRNGNLRGYYTGTEIEELNRLRFDIEYLRGE